MGRRVEIVTLEHWGFLLDLSSILSSLYQPLTRGFLTEYLTFHKARAIMNLASPCGYLPFSSCCPSGKIEQHGEFLYRFGGRQQGDPALNGFRFRDVLLPAVGF